MKGVKRRRSPGAGRKPKGDFAGKSAWLSTRITIETREALEASAQANGRSLSQEIERLLKEALKARREANEPQPIRALCYVIKRIARMASGADYVDLNNYQGDERAVMEEVLNLWRTDPFRYRAFEEAVRVVLYELRPEGEIAPPHIDDGSNSNSRELKFLREMYSAPDRLADYITFAALKELAQDGDLSSGQRRFLEKHPHAASVYQDSYYGMRNAARDLGFAETSIGKKMIRAAKVGALLGVGVNPAKASDGEKK